MEKPALIMLDYQEAICREDGSIGSRSGIGAEVARRGVLEAARRVLMHFRSRERPVVHVGVAFDHNYQNMTSVSPRFAEIRKEGLLKKGDPGTGFCVEVAPDEFEPVLSKGCVNPFIGTGLNELLNRIAPTELVLGGVTTNHVVESACRFAADSGYRTVVLEDLCASADAATHRYTIERAIPAYGAVLDSGIYMRR